MASQLLSFRYRRTATDQAGNELAAQGAKIEAAARAVHVLDVRRCKILLQRLDDVLRDVQDGLTFGLVCQPRP